MGKRNQPQTWRYSKEFVSPESYFSDVQEKVNSFEELYQVLNKIRDNNSELLLWRGQENSKWGLHSSLFRILAEQTGTALTWDEGTQPSYEEKQSFPDEGAMVEAEKKFCQLPGKNGDSIKKER